MRKFFAGFIFVVLGLYLSHCEDVEKPNYPIEPSITFKGLEFKEVPGAGTNDSLILTIKYQDGDSDLGIDPDDAAFSSEPFQQSYYFLENGNGDTTKVATNIVYDNHDYPYVLVNARESGKLVTDQTRNKSNYSYLPAYTPNNCEFYSEDRLLVHQSAADASYNILDTLYAPSNDRYYLIQEPVLYAKNYNHYNITLEFYVSDDGVNFAEYKWSKYCYEYDGRFPYLGGPGIYKAGPFRITVKASWEGEIRYGMANPAFIPFLGTKKMMLKIKIKDRALHTSNAIETPVFTLDQIRKN